MAEYAYPYDDTGSAASNLVKDEVQVLTPNNDDPFRFFVPTHAPLYATNLKMMHRDSLGVLTPMVEGVDYAPTVKYIAATRANGSLVFGGFTIINHRLNGVVLLDYQCLGGKYSADRDFVVAAIAEHNYNPRVCAWDQLTSIQELFPPSSHPQDLDSFYGMKDLIQAMNGIRDVLAVGSPPSNLLITHVLDTNNPHQTLPLVPNLAKATDAEVQSAQAVDKTVTLKQLVQAGAITPSSP